MSLICLGELVIDFLPGNEEGIYIRKAGGAPANVAVAAARNGLDVGFYGRVGNDDRDACIAAVQQVLPDVDFLKISEEEEDMLGVALKPGTSLNTLEYVLEKCDAVLLMLINPGYAQSKSEGQVPYAARKVRELHEMIASRGLDTKVILDGRISKQNMADFAPEGIADIFVAGSTCLDKTDLKNSAIALKQYRESILK